MALHIHVPKPLHGWKAFFNEIFVIAIGILIALGLEQVIERFHWYHQSEQASETLRRELGWNRHSLKIVVEDADCMLGNAGDLARLAEQGNVAAVRDFFNTGTETSNRIESFRTLRFGGWEAAKASGLLAHMATEERLGFAKSYDSLGRAADMNRDVIRAAKEVRAATYSYDGSPGDKRDLLRAIAYYRVLFPTIRFYRDVTMRQMDAVRADPNSATDPNIPTYLQCIRWPARGSTKPA